MGRVKKKKGGEREKGIKIFWALGLAYDINRNIWSSQHHRRRKYYLYFANEDEEEVA